MVESRIASVDITKAVCTEGFFIGDRTEKSRVDIRREVYGLCHDQFRQLFPNRRYDLLGNTARPRR